MTERAKIILQWTGVIFFAVLAVLVFGCLSAHAQANDIYVGACASNDACILDSNLSWSVGAKSWRFAAKYPHESIRIWVLNQNPTSAHTSQTFSVFITDDATAPSLLNNADRWVQACLVSNTVTGAQLTNVAANAPIATPGANGKATGYSVGMYAQQVAIRMTGATAAAGNPDTFTIGIVQEPTNYPGGPQPGCDSSTGAASTASTPADGTSNTGIPGSQSYEMLFNGTGWDRARGGINVDGTSVFGFTPGLPYLFNGTNWDRLRSGQAGITSLLGAAAIAPVAVDPCQSSSIAKSSITVQNSGASGTNVQFLPINGTTKYYICGVFGIYSSGTAASSFWNIAQGTGVNCGTSTGSMIVGGPNVTTTAITFYPISFGGGATIATSNAGFALCDNESGTGSSLSITVVYVNL